MSKKGYISRYLVIIKKLKNKPFSNFEEIRSHLEYQLDFLKDQDEGIQIGFSKRTFQRDIREIRNLFGIDIEFSKSKNAYYISNTEGENLNFQRMMEAFDLFNLLSRTQHASPYIHFENRAPLGTENFGSFLQAIEQKRKLEFTYHRYNDDDVSQREVEPFALKEFKNRWYLMATDLKDSRMKSFALDRCSNPILGKEFRGLLDSTSIEDGFRYSFGIMSPNALEPQEVILSFTPHQGKYIRSLPLHHTQEILQDDLQAFCIRMQIYITYDFIMELLSYGDRVKVLKPLQLAGEIKTIYQSALDQYNEIN